MAHVEGVGAIDRNFIADANRAHSRDLESDYEALRVQLNRRGVDIDAVTRKVGEFRVAIPSWGVGTGGTRFARFPGPGEPRNIFEKFEDCGVIHALGGSTPTISLHLPWDNTNDLAALKERATQLGLGFDAVNSNTFQDQAGQKFSYKYGSL
ncbi:MAG: sugar isomerase, partial [Gammaproteobacteria bacterium]